MIYLGIDPGLDGAVAGVYDGTDQHGKPFVFDTPTLKTGRRESRARVNIKREYDLVTIREILQQQVSHGIYAAIEHVHSMPGQGVRSMFSMGYGVGIWEAMLASLGIPYVRVGPQQWKNEMLRAHGVGTLKDASVLRAKQLFPSINMNGTKGGARDGRAEALLIAEYLRRQHLQGKR